MNSFTTEYFRKHYALLPAAIKKQVKESYKLFKANQYHPSLRFKRVHSYRPIFSVRITKDYRAVGILEKDKIIWFWIGSHSEYDILLKKLKKK